ncbi:AraC family transcriptional regulator [Halomonas heilongjiangensis]|uniref:AraC family transcriptional regulator n=1 Tax=Halomonas heilongjiangensis TaxID=1387883 RepID=A0A2N7TVI9_9GAMM|nr:AraC family transcriptional regulator [Halomonas heilongjiangensis]PMR72196.1 AraC family transcriptional regulator [Halomonas heilongjiangensis]PXX91447.1 AraC family transcriptional regulator [Halomonas heilongjiangensis]
MSQDTLSQVLRSVRLRGAVFYHVEGSTRWVSESPPAAEVAALIMPGVEHVMAYHVLTHGECWAAVIGDSPVALREGDVVIFPRGDPHVMSSEPGMRGTVDLTPYGLPRPEQLPFFASRQGESLSMSRLDRESERHAATLVCGFFGCDANPFNPLLASLPHLLHVPARAGADDDWIAHFIRFALSESTDKRPGGEALLERLSEAMFVELMRRYLEAMPEEQSNWFAGLRDRHVGRALALLHQRPGEAWTIDKLADYVGLSRSALHERFARFTGHAPMHYLAKWRMQVAAGLLRQSSASVASIALEVGYESEAAFSRAFRRETGLPPATWRREQTRLAERESLY